MGKKLGDHLFKGVVKEKAQEKLRAAGDPGGYQDSL